MHELSIATNIIEIVEQELDARGISEVRAIHLRLGSLAGVAREALLFCYGLACEGTRIAGSRLVFEDGTGTEIEIVGLEVDG